MRKQLLSLMFGVCLCGTVGAVDYTQGVFIVNEDYYGMNNSTINHLNPDDPDGNYWTYRVIQNENPGVELGCTSAHGAIHNGRFYIISKQDKDGGASVAGGRITIANVSDMKVLKQIRVIDESGETCDGRGFIGVDEKKGYVSTSNGVWVLDLEKMEITGQVEGTENPYIDDSYMCLYGGQCGSMELVEGIVFVAHQSKGLLAIDPAQDKVVYTLSIAEALKGHWSLTEEESADIEAGTVKYDDCCPGIGSVVKDKNGKLWLSVAKGLNGMGVSMPFLICVDPATMQTKVASLPSADEAPHNSWYAWTPDAFCASAVSDCLYWKSGVTMWFSGSKIYKYDITTGVTTMIVDTNTPSEGNWQVYGCSMRLHPLTDEIYVSLYKGFMDKSYVLRRYTTNGVKIQDYPMIQHYWFPSLPVFPTKENVSSGVSSVYAQSSAVVNVVGNQLHVMNGTNEQCCVFDLSGRMVKSVVVTDSDFWTSLDVPAGIYVVTVKDTTFKVSVK